jgi:hypothetical protein
MITALCEEEPISGLQEMRRGALMAHEHAELQERMETYFNPDVDWTTFSALSTGLSKDAGMFKPAEARVKLLKTESFQATSLRRYALYPLDNRWCYYSAKPPLWNRPRPELLAQCADGESFLIVRRFAERSREGKPGFLTSALPDYHLLRPNAVAIPLRLATAPAEVPENSNGQATLYGSLDSPTAANLSAVAREYLATLTPDNPEENPDFSRAVWLHALAIIYSPQYLSENADGLKSDLPRLPLPTSLDKLLQSAHLGTMLGKLLHVEKTTPGVISGKLRKELSVLGRITGPAGLSLAITAGWGYFQKEKDVVMPGSGIAKKRDFTDAEKLAISDGASELGMSLDEVLTIWGGNAVDVYLNNESHWATVPLAVWEYTIGGYLVQKKWISYRESEVLGRDITKDEAREFTHMVRRIAALLLMEPALDANYLAVKAAAYDWPQSEAEEEAPVAVEEEGE